MDSESHKKTSSAVHENHGVHLCHKCGWPFPNPHPSAKHRRAHKRVCGTIEGYKLIDSKHAASDDEHVSDEDHRTPSPKGGKELHSAGAVGLRSNKSEDEVFSDAVTEFSESGFSPGMEERLEAVKQLDKNVGKVLVNSLNESQFTKDDANADTTQSLTHPMESPQGSKRDMEMSDPEVVGSKTNQSETTKPISDIGTEGISTGVDKINGPQSDSSLVTSESVLVSANKNTSDECEKLKELISSGTERDIKGNENLNEVKPLVDTVDTSGPAATERPELESKLVETEGKSPGPLMLETVVSETGRKTSDLVSEPKFEHRLHDDGKTSHAGKVGEGFEGEKELTCELQAEIAKHDISPDIEPSNCINASFIDQVEADSTQDLNVSRHDQLPAVCDSKEHGNEETHLLSVVETLPVVENPEIKSGDFKGYKVFKSSFPLDLGPTETIRTLEDNYEVTVSGVHSSALSSDTAGSLNNSPSDLYAAEDDRQKDGGLVHSEAEVITSGLRVASNDNFESNVLGGYPDTQANHTLEGSQPHYADEKSSQNNDTEPTTMKCSDAISVVPPTSEETLKTTYSHGGENADIHGMDKNVYIAPENGKIDAGDELSAVTTTTSGHLENSAGPKNDQNTSSVSQVDSHVHENTGIGNADIADNGIREGGAEEKLIKHDDRALESVEQLPNSTNLDEVIVSDLAINPRDIENLDGPSSLPKCSDEGCQRTPDGLDMGSAARDMVFDLTNEQTAGLAVDSEFLNKSSVRVEDETARNAIILETLQGEGEGDDKIRKEHSSVPAVDDSVISSSRTDSLEGNWGSVSVLSTQSDVTAVADTEVLSSTDTQAPEKSDGDLLKPQAAVQECHPDMADVFEAPSFMTLGESEERVYKNPASEIQTAQNTERPKAEALQASWFPSITNVVNESESRKKNEQIIAKVTNWSTGKQQHGPLKNLLSEAHSETKVKSPNAKQVLVVNQADGTASKNNGTAVTTVSSIMGSETPSHDATKKDIHKEWNSPARYPIEIKKEKRKGKPYWVPFVCCTSVHQDV